MKYFIILIFVIISPSVFSQQEIQMEGYKAVIFADSIELPFNIDSIESRYTPLKKDVVIANDLIIENKNSFISAWGKSFQKEIKKSFRQYIGYCDVKGNLHLIVIFLNMKAKGSRENFQGWLNSPMVGFGKFYEKNLKVLDANLTKKIVRIY